MENEELQDIGDVLHVDEEHRQHEDPDPKKAHSHAAFGDGGPDDVSDVEEGEEYDVHDGVWDDEGGEEK